MFFEDFFNINKSKVIAVKVVFDNSNIDFSEIESLINVLGAQIESYVWQKREVPDSKFFIGSGKVDEILNELNQTKADYIIFDNNLKPSHVVNLEKTLCKRIFDRSEIILEIFRKHAQTYEAKLEIELARLQYILPRLRRMWSHLEEQVSGRMMAGRGPGEKQIESDRRLIRKRMEKVNEELEEIKQHKERIIEQRNKYLTCALLGYTNAGKTTIFNTLSNLTQKTSTELFTTLDTKLSLIKLPNKIQMYMVDTVGFIENMPKHLLRAFYTTLKEAIYSDIVILVFDIARDNFEHQISSVENILNDLKIKPQEKIYIFNKMDKVTDQLKIITYLKKYADKNPIIISAIKSDCKDKLITMLVNITDKILKSYKVDVDITNGKLINFIHSFMQIIEQKINTDKITYIIKTHPFIIQQLLNNYKIEVETM